MTSAPLDIDGAAVGSARASQKQDRLQDSNWLDNKILMNYAW
jgi:hypothetical protein